MKKNKLSFLIVSSLLAIATLVGCNSSDESSSSKAGDSNSIASSESSQVNPASSSSNSQGAQSSSSSVQPISSSQGTSSGQQSTGPQSSVGPQSSSGQSQGSSQGDSSSGQSQGDSSSQGGSQETKTDWTNEEKQAIQAFLHGEVIPFIPFDVTFNFNAAHKTVSIESKANMPEGFLRTYLQAFYELDSGWEVQDVSADYNADYGSCYMAKKAVQENGQTRYVAVAFFGGDYDEVTHSMTCSSTGKFYLEATDPYVYEYPAEFIGEWLGQSFGTTIVPPDMHAEYYSLDNEGILIAYSETNLEDAYKRILLGTEQFNIDANKDNLGFIVAHPTDGSYTMKFKYDASEKAMILTVEGPKGWNNSAINAIFTKNNVTPFSLASISDPNIQFSATEASYGEQTYMFIGVGGVDVQTVKTYINDLKTLGYKIANPNVVVESNQYFTTVNVVTNEGMYTVYVTYSTADNANSLTIQLSLTPNPNVVKSWPAASIARYLDAQKDTVPAFTGECYGYAFSITNTYNNVAVIVDNGNETTAKESYIRTLTSVNGYTSSGTLGGQPAFKSPNNEILVAIGCDPVSFPGEINILIQEITVTDTLWPAESIATAVTALYSENPITEALPALDVSDASECYVNGLSDRTQVEIDIDDFASAKNEVIREFTTSGWKYDAYYGFNTAIGEYGAYISPQRQLAVNIDAVNGDLVIYVQAYYDQNYEEWPSNSLSTTMTKWGIKKDRLPSFDTSNFIVVNESSSEQKVEIDVYVGSSVRETALTDYCVALEGNDYGYHYDRNIGGFLSNNHELFVQVSTNDNGLKIVVSNATLVYKVVGYNSDWSFANGLRMNDATNPEENYDVQYAATFHVEANSKFKILDSDGNWLGGTIASYSNANYDNFTKLQENDDIQVNAAGTVTAYLKIYEDLSKDIWLEFVKDVVPMAEWPTEQVETTLSDWSVDDEIPALPQDEAISAINYAEINETSFSITVVGGASFINNYKELLNESYTPDETNWYVPASNKIAIEVHADGQDLVITVKVKEEEPELKPWPEEDINDFFGDAFVFVPEIKIADASYEITNGEVVEDYKILYITVTVENASNAATSAIRELSNQFGYYYTENGYVTDNEGNWPIYAFDNIGENSFDVEIRQKLEEAPQNTWAATKAAVESELPEGSTVPNLEIDGATAYIYNGGNGSIDITFSEGADLDSMLSAICVKLENADYHYSRRFMEFVNTGTYLMFGVSKDEENNAVCVYYGSYDYSDEGYGIGVLAYDEAENYYYLDDECIGYVNPSNESERVVEEYSFTEGTRFFIYDFTNETEFNVSVDPASIGGNYADYFENDAETKVFVVKQDFTGTIYIKLIQGNDQIYVGLVVEP